MSDPAVRLIELAHLHGIQTEYVSNLGAIVHAETAALLAVLRALGAPLESLDDVEAAIDAWWIAHWRRPIEPVSVAWDGHLPPLRLRLAAHEIGSPLRCVLTDEGGTSRAWEVQTDTLATIDEADAGGQRYVELHFTIEDAFELGYHTLTLSWAGRECETLIIAAPMRAYDGSGKRSWGVFLPLYAVRDERNWGAGNLTDLDELFSWVQGLGGDLAGTLPLFAAYLDEPFEPSPYAPVSRLFWNEFYLDITAVPELAVSERARELLASEDVQQEIAELQAAPLVDYRRGMALRRAVLDELAAALLEPHSERRAAFERWIDEHPSVRDYARFRATVETHGTTFYEWPERQRNGILHEGDFEPQREHYHLYVQWLAHEQLSFLAEKARQGGSGLYLDFPLGVHGAGYDVWRWHALFAQGVSVGAPADPLNSYGQDWGFPPLHPQRLREQGYRYQIDSLRTLLSLSGTLRIDHIMGMRRLYWIPADMDATQGVYVEYNFEEQLALLALESQRYKTLIVGEDLGTVPEEVRAEMAEHNLYRMCILPFSLGRDGDRPYLHVPSNSLAGLNTHDITPFATYLMQLDDETYRDLLRLLRESGHLSGDAGDPVVLCRCSLEYLAASDARMVMVNLEDLWGETERQNIPGTVDEHPNWRRKAALGMATITSTSEVVDTLKRIEQLRRAGG